MRRLMLLLGLLTLLACSLSSTVPATPTRVPLLPTTESTVKPTRPPVGNRIIPTEPPITDAPLATLESPPATLDGLVDDFSDPGSGWDINSDTEGSVGYENGAYVIQVDQADYSLWANPGQTFGDVVAAVDAQLAEGSVPADMGVICRYQDADNFIYGDVTSDGFYGISQVKDGDLSVLTGGGKLQPSDAIHQGTRPNRIQFLCLGNRFVLSINDQFLDAVEVTAPANGDVGLIAGTFDQAGARVRFDDFSAALPPPDTEVGPVSSGDQVLFADDFSDPQSGWDVRSTENGASGYRAGRYFIRVETPKFQLWSTPGQDFTGDVNVEVTAGAADGPAENEMGVICRYQDKQNFVYASIGSDGFYAIVEIKADEATILTGKGKFQYAEAIPLGSETYVVRLACAGDRFTLFVDDREIDSATSGTFTRGDVGLLAGAFDEGGVEILFDDFKVTKP